MRAAMNMDEAVMKERGRLEGPPASETLPTIPILTLAQKQSDRVKLLLLAAMFSPDWLVLRLCFKLKLCSKMLLFKKNVVPTQEFKELLQTVLNAVQYGGSQIKQQKYSFKI